MYLYVSGRQSESAPFLSQVRVWKIVTSLWRSALPRIKHFRWCIHRNLLLQLVAIIIHQKKFNTLKILVNFEILIIEHVFLKQTFVCDN